MTERKDITLLFSTRIVRLFAYGFLSVVLALYWPRPGSALEYWRLFSLTWRERGRVLMADDVADRLDGGAC
jgi:hypothetical protein